MDEIYIPSNSNRNRENPVEEKIVKIERPPRVRRGFFSRVADFFSRRDPVELANDIWDNSIKPGGKQLLSDTLHKIVDGVVYENGEKRYTSTYSNSNGNTMIRYDKQSVKSNASNVERTPSNVRPQDVEFDSEEQAKEKLQLMDELASVNGLLRMSEFFDICEYKCPHTYENWCWDRDDLVQIRIMRKTNGKYRFVNIPKAIPVNQK